MQHLEFTIEPFREGQLGEHVTAPAEAIREMGIAGEHDATSVGTRDAT